MTAVKEIKELTWQQKKRKAFQKLTISDLKAIYDFVNKELNTNSCPDKERYSQISRIVKNEIIHKINNCI